jgi:hypothetical protein
MRLLLISPYFPPQPAVASLRAHAFAWHWADAGVEVAVLTTAKRGDQRGLDLPRDGFEVVELPFRGSRVAEWMRRKHKCSEHNVQTASDPQRTAGIPGILRRLRDKRGLYCSVRMPDLTDHWVRPAVDWIRQNGPWDVLVSSSGPYTAHMVAMAAKRAGRAPRWVADFRDLWVENHTYSGLFPFTLRERALERRILREADLLCTVSEGLERKLKRKSHVPVVVVYNGCDESVLSSLPPERIFPDDEKMRLVYTGALYPPGQDPAPLFRAVQLLKYKRPAVASRISVEVAARDCRCWLELAEPFGAAGVINAHGMLRRIDALRMQRDADALLTIEWADPAEGVLTGKLFEYLFASAPIVMIGPVAGSPIGGLITEAGRGLCLGEDPQHIASTLTDLVERPQSINLKRDDAVIGAFSRRNQSLRLLERIRQLTTDYRPSN